MLLDTNIVIAACKSDGAWLSPWTRHPEAACASVTRVEALGFTGISAGEDEAIREFLSEVLSYALDDEVVESAVRLRQQKRMKLGDAIIAATAQEYGVPLVTRNVDDFKHIPGLQIINPFAAQP
jgi:predicted nucleic acid-binding protein